MDAGLLAFNYTLGLLAFFSPCGYPMLPAYLTYYLTREGAAPPGRARAALRGLAGGALAALGAFTVLAGIGLAAAALGAPFKERLLILELVGGLILITLGTLVLLGRGPTVKLALQPTKTRGALGLLSFGALYAAIASSCVAPLFLGVLVVAQRAPTLLESAAHVSAYALGFATLLITVTALIATAQHDVATRLKRILPHVERIGGAALILVGVYLIYYWARVAY